MIFTSLSRLPIDYYWNQLQPRRAVGEQSFPAEIDSHPGFEGAPHRPFELQEEVARVTKENAEIAGSHRVFYLTGFHAETDGLLKAEFDAHFTPLPELAKSCANMGSYFQYISAYSCQSATFEAKR